MEYVQKFRELFGLSGRSERCAHGRWADSRDDLWIGIEINDYGFVRLSMWERWEPVVAELGWFRGELALLDGDPNDLAPLLWIAERIGLDTSHPDIEEIRKCPQYAEIAENGVAVVL